jgi:transmembrane sensor
MMLDQYSQPEELLTDESFLNWYFKTGSEDHRQWEEWMGAGERNRDLVQRAVALLELTRLPERRITADQIDRAAARLSAGIDRAAKRTRVLPLIGRWRWVAAACCVGLLAVGGGMYWLNHSAGAVIRTEYGQLGQQVLPDGTEVTMNANSRLQLAASPWVKGADREVWISGEAFFHVTHTPEKSRFIVHLDHSDVIVTGTRFNVVNRPGKENIMLEEGSVILRTASGKEIAMRPGDFVTVAGGRAEMATVRPDSLMAWRDQSVFLYNTPMRELVNIVYDHYGVRIHLANDSTGTKTVTGILKNNDLETLLNSLEMTKAFEVKRQDDGTITIASRPLEK